MKTVESIGSGRFFVTIHIVVPGRFPPSIDVHGASVVFHDFSGGEKPEFGTDPFSGACLELFAQLP